MLKFVSDIELLQVSILQTLTDIIKAVVVVAIPCLLRRKM